MRVAIFTETYLPSINGVVTHVKTLKDGLQSLGHEVLIITADSNTKRHIRSKDIMYCPAVKIKSIYNYDIASPISVHRLQLIKKFNPDVIHIHNEFGIGISGAVIAAMLKKPLVYTLHTMYDDYVYYVAKRRFMQDVTGSFIHNYAKALGEASSAITGPSKKVEEYMRKCGVKKPVVVIPNSIELDKFDKTKINLQESLQMRKNYKIADDETLFCFCGRLGTEKNVTMLLEYFAEKVKLEDKIKLIILGGGPTQNQHEIEAKNLKIDELVIFTGAVMHDDIPKYYGFCDAYITASLSDTCSISMLEAMAMGLPVLHIHDPLNAGQVVDGVNGYIYHDAEEMYEYMLKIKNMSKIDLNTFGEKARASVENSGSERLAKSLLEVYESVIKEKPKQLKFKVKR